MFEGYSNVSLCHSLLLHRPSDFNALDSHLIHFQRAADSPRATFCVNADFEPFCGEFAPGAEGACQNFGPDLNDLV